MINAFDLAGLKCPICDAKMVIEDQKRLCCAGEKKHSYDISASGYVNLASPKQCGGGDIKSAVKARSSFLDTELYAPIASKTTELLLKYLNSGARVLDAGCGEGYYTVRIAKNGFFTLGFDISKMAVEAAAKRAKREGSENTVFGVASVYTLPVFDASVDGVVNIFAPCVEAEYSRVLNENGVLVVVQAGKEHLMGLKRKLYDNAHENDERADLPRELELVCEERLRYDILVEGNENLKNLFAMTPYYWRTSQEDAEKLDSIEKLKTEIDVKFSVYKKESKAVGEF